MVQNGRKIVALGSRPKDRIKDSKGDEKGERQKDHEKVHPSEGRAGEVKCLGRRGGKFTYEMKGRQYSGGSPKVIRRATPLTKTHFCQRKGGVLGSEFVVIFDNPNSLSWPRRERRIRREVSLSHV